MTATQAALGAFPRDVLSLIDGFRCRRVRRTKTAHNRLHLYLVQKWT
jgi:hypothetical protein